MLEWVPFGGGDKKKKVKAVRGLYGTNDDNEPWTDGKVWFSSALESQTNLIQKYTCPSKETNATKCYIQSNLNIINIYLHWRKNKGNFTKLVFLWVDYNWYFFLLSTFLCFWISLIFYNMCVLNYYVITKYIITNVI